MLVRFNTVWLSYKTGQVAEINDGQAEFLVARGLATKVEPEPPKQPPKPKAAKRGSAKQKSKPDSAAGD